MRLLICYEKDCQRYFAASTDKDLFDVCIRILHERLKEGWYNPSLYLEEPSLKNLGMSLKDIRNLPKGTVRHEAERQYEVYQAQVKEWDSIRKFKEDVILTLKKVYVQGLGKNTYHFLASRNDAEYERVDLVETEN